MDREHEMARAALESSRRMFLDNVAGVSLEEALDASGGYRSILGLVKHTAGWSTVYHSHAFDEAPRSWTEADWPRGLRERIDPSQAYLEELLAWFERSAQLWLGSVEVGVELAEPRPVHWGERWPLRDIVAYVAAHWAYHAGEINMILAIRRAEAWEYGEHVEENHISTLGHSVRMPWTTDEQVEREERDMRRAAAVGRDG
ncbi:MAG TPA: DUF664 domain-containing protein [Actinomycetota bacterium]|nr:DUF664 domain-containing protein [Actinomycetota bacterium]